MSDAPDDVGTGTRDGGDGGGAKRCKEPFLTVSGKPVYFEEDWHSGIGGGLWSTGSAMARYFATQHASELVADLMVAGERNSDSVGGCLRGGSTTASTRGKDCSVLELGSGNGLAAASLLALLAAGSEDGRGRQEGKGETSAGIGAAACVDVVVTDTGERHLDLIRKTMDANSHLLRGSGSVRRVHVVEHRWGEFQQDGGASAADAASVDNAPLVDKMREGRHKFDLIIGSDVAYREELYDPLIASLSRFSDAGTLALIGVTMADTTPFFFRKLRRAGFAYRRFADHLLDPEFRGTTFGIFLIRREERV